jgi:hypothetical protein
VAVRVAAVAADVALLLRRLTADGAGAFDAAAGGRGNNARLLPALMRMGTQLCDCATVAELAPLAAAAEQLQIAPERSTANEMVWPLSFACVDVWIDLSGAFPAACRLRPT